MKARTWMALLGLAALAPFGAPAASPLEADRVRLDEAPDTPQALVLSVHGSCRYSDNATTFTALKAGRVLTQGAVVRTGPGAQTDLFFRRIGTTVRLQAETEVALEQLTRHLQDGVPVMTTLLAVRTGRIFTVVRALVPGSTFEIRNAAGRSVVEGGGTGRYIVTADGTHVTDEHSAVPLKVVGEKGITVVGPGQTFLASQGNLLPRATPVAELMLINLDELQSLAEQLTPALIAQARAGAPDDAEALVLSVGLHASGAPSGQPFARLKVGQVLTQGAVVRTGDDTVVDLFLRRWGTTIRLTPNTELGLENLTKSTGPGVSAMAVRLHLRQGRVFCFIRIPVPHSTFEVRTALGRSLLESAGAGRYDIRANGTIVAGKSSIRQLKVITKRGVTTIVPGQTFNAENGFLLPTAPSEVELLVIQMDELAALAEALALPLPADPASPTP